MSTGARSQHVYSPRVDQSHLYLGYDLSRCVGCADDVPEPSAV